MENVILGVITPDAYKIREKIFGIMQEKHFIITKSETILLKDGDIETLCTNPENSIKKDWKKGESLVFIASKERGILRFFLSLLLEKKDVKKEFAELVGNIDQPGSIRDKFALNDQSKCAIFVPEKQEAMGIFFPN
jgi:hypothetical protein